jgi:dTDP-4-amino-4,6-dideoxygalactose transaminase
MSLPGRASREEREPLAMSGPDICDMELRAVTETVRSGCLSIGPRLEVFERASAAYVGTRHAVGVSSGTAGLHLAVIAAGAGPGDFVITTPFSFVASANCVLYEHAIPVFVDVEPGAGNLDPAQVYQAVLDIASGGAGSRRWLPRSVRRRTGALKAILPVHAFGEPADMDPLVEAARLSDLVVIEDACEALGSMYKGRPAGTIGDVGVFAFYPNKQVTTGEGGMMVTNRDGWASLFRSLRNQGRDVMDAWLRHDRLGYNYRMDELSAALGGAQMSRIDGLLAARARVAGWYTERLSQHPHLDVPHSLRHTTRTSWFVYVIRLHGGIDRAAVMSRLADRGIPSRPYFTPIHLQPFYRERFRYRPGDFPVAEDLSQRSLALPFSGTMTEAQVDRVCGALLSIVTHRSTHTGRRRTA